ncbi:hypothetical protein [Methylobacterium sp. yr668]|uniref:hypothetical protein n=1 Tax=Methylobacterium sp. yr668 TaxID=1761801 RepID=UPI0008E52A00|nr:hypothetical protein [Methylobacterium sp. yr668]SFT27213.1 hypothetical protein SAMN04487845_1386 [Methylobacterium sp. yr668]
MLTLKQVAVAIDDTTRRPRGWLLLGAPHQGQGRDARFDKECLVSWCEAGAEDARAAGDPENAGRWQGYVDRLRAA